RFQEQRGHFDCCSLRRGQSGLLREGPSTICATIVGGMGFLIPLAIAPRFFSFNFDSLPKALVVYLVAAGLLLTPRLWRNSWERLQATTQGRWFLVFFLAEGLSLIVST